MLRKSILFSFSFRSFVYSSNSLVRYRWFVIVSSTAYPFHSLRYCRYAALEHTSPWGALFFVVWIVMMVYVLANLVLVMIVENFKIEMDEVSVMYRALDTTAVKTEMYASICGSLVLKACLPVRV